MSCPHVDPGGSRSSWHGDLPRAFTPTRSACACAACARQRSSFSRQRCAFPGSHRVHFNSIRALSLTTQGNPAAGWLQYGGVSNDDFAACQGHKAVVFQQHISGSVSSLLASEGIAGRRKLCARGAQRITAFDALTETGILRDSGSIVFSRYTLNAPASCSVKASTIDPHSRPRSW